MSQTRKADIAIVGGGMAGSTATVVFARAGYDVVLVDQHSHYPPVFAADKIAGEQIPLLKKLGLFEAFAAASTPVQRVINAKFGKAIDHGTKEEYGLHYQTMVETVRAELPTNASFVTGHVANLEVTAGTQRVSLLDGSSIEARLIVLATGFSDVLPRKLGFSRNLLKQNHSLSIGFDLVRKAGQSFTFPSLTYYGERVGDGVDYISIFPIADRMRANVFAYCGIHDPWAQSFRRDPHAALYGVMPGLQKFLPDFDMAGPLQMRGLDLYFVENPIRAGVVLIGDAFQTSCPAVGTGISRLLTDIGCLKDVHLPGWLATPGMDASKIGQFYADPIKRASDAKSIHGANYRRAVTTELGLGWALHRRQVYLRRRLRGLLGRLNPYDRAA
jgi:2-polyprenyl-6-methoxyphenol hydroxylase-like FAD-dependent oxidoreductase